MAIKKGTLDEILSGRDPEQVFSNDGLFDELKKVDPVALFPVKGFHRVRQRHNEITVMSSDWFLANDCTKAE